MEEASFSLEGKGIEELIASLEQFGEIGESAVGDVGEALGRLDAEMEEVAKEAMKSGAAVESSAKGAERALSRVLGLEQEREREAARFADAMRTLTLEEAALAIEREEGVSAAQARLRAEIQLLEMERALASTEVERTQIANRLTEAQRRLALVVQQEVVPAQSQANAAMRQAPTLARRFGAANGDVNKVANALSSVGAAAGGAVGQVSALVTQGIAGFATGGPLALGAAALATGIMIYRDRTRQAREEAEKLAKVQSEEAAAAMKEMRDRIDEVNSGLATQARRRAALMLAEAQGISVEAAETEGQLDSLARLIRSSAAAIAELDSDRALLNQSIIRQEAEIARFRTAGVGTAGEERRLESLKAERDELDAQIESWKQRNEEQAKAFRLIESTTENDAIKERIDRTRAERDEAGRLAGERRKAAAAEADRAQLRALEFATILQQYREEEAAIQRRMALEASAAAVAASNEASRAVIAAAMEREAQLARDLAHERSVLAEATARGVSTEMVELERQLAMQLAYLELVEQTAVGQEEYTELREIQLQRVANAMAALGLLEEQEKAASIERVDVGKQVFDTLASAAESAMSRVAGAIGGAVEQWALYSRAAAEAAAVTATSGEEAAANMWAEAQAHAASIAGVAATEALMEGARAAAAAATGNAPKATAHGIAAGLFAGVAGVSAVTARAIGETRGETSAEREAREGRDRGARTDTGTDRPRSEAPVTQIVVQVQGTSIANDVTIARGVEAAMRRNGRYR